MFRWLSYGHDPKLAGKEAGVNKDFFKKREFSFTIANDIYIRYLCFANEDEMRREIQKKQPHKIDIGAIYSHPPKVLFFFLFFLLFSSSARHCPTKDPTNFASKFC